MYHIFYFLLGSENYYEEIKILIIDWIKNNYIEYESFFAEDPNETKAEAAKKEFEYIKTKIILGLDIMLSK